MSGFLKASSSRDGLIHPRVDLLHESRGFVTLGIIRYLNPVHSTVLVELRVRAVKMGPHSGADGRRDEILFLSSHVVLLH
jgi:hypothetical protein